MAKNRNWSVSKVRNIESNTGESARSPTPEGKISIVLFTRLAELENDCNLTQGCRRFPYLVLFPVFDFISH